jgi:hypothetical protein
LRTACRGGALSNRAHCRIPSVQCSHLYGSFCKAVKKTLPGVWSHPRQLATDEIPLNMHETNSFSRMVVVVGGVWLFRRDTLNKYNEKICLSMEDVKCNRYILL